MILIVFTGGCCVCRCILANISGIARNVNLGGHLPSPFLPFCSYVKKRKVLPEPYSP